MQTGMEIVLFEVNRASIFDDKEFSEIHGFMRGNDFIEVICGCTSQKYGDSVGRLRVYETGVFEIDCDCCPGCPERKLSPDEFEKHSLRQGPRNWKNHVWVTDTTNGKKVPLTKTPLLRYYKEQSTESDGSKGQQQRRSVHRDEFVLCSLCNKHRRFQLRTKEECKIHHDASTNKSWTCFEIGLTCDVEEERECRRASRGCPIKILCKGCTSCVCFGCRMCRFSDCECRACVDFTRNA